MSNSETTPSARVRVSNWPGWIWLLPLGVLGFLVWLGIRAWLSSGETVTVSFRASHGITSGTPVKFRDVKVGQVDEVRFSEDVTGVLIDLSMQRRVTNLLRDGTRFWIASPSLSSLGQIQDLMSGPHIGMDPGPGEPARVFSGLDRLPVVDRSDPGRHFTLMTDDPGSLTIGSPVRTLGIPVGEVRGVTFAEGGDRCEVRVFVRDEFVHRVREFTVFWRAGKMSVDMEGAGASIEVPSLTTLATGAVDFATPGQLDGDIAENDQVFRLHASRRAARAAPGGPRFAYLVRFPEPVGGLAPGSDVVLEGVVVGHVAQIKLAYDAGRLHSEALISIEPERLGLEIADDHSRTEVRDTLNDALEKLVRQGLRAQPSGGLLPGSRNVSLTHVGQSQPAEFDLDQSPPVLPGVAGGDDLDDALASLGRVADAAERLPLSEIGNHLRDAAQRMDTLLHDPAIDDSIEHLNATLAHAENVAAVTDHNAEALATSLRNTAEEARNVARRASQLIGTSVRRDQDARELVEELTDAAEAVNDLASYLSRNPEALITGRDGR